MAGRRGRAGRGRCDARGRAPADDKATHARGDRCADPDRRADAARGSRRGRTGPAHGVERARGRALTRDRGSAGHSRALPRSGRVGAHRDPARRVGAGRARRRARVLAAADEARVPGACAARVDGPVRGAGGRADHGARVLARRGLHAADGAVPAAREAAPDGRTGGGSARPRRHGRGVRGGADAQPRPALVRLRDLGRRDLDLQVDDLHLEPQLRRAELAARRPRAAARDRPTSRVLEGREPGHLRRREVGAQPAGLDHAGHPRRRPAVPAPQHAGDQGLDPQPAHRPVHHRRLRDQCRHPAPERPPDARRPVRRAPHAAPR